MREIVKRITLVLFLIGTLSLMGCSKEGEMYLGKNNDVRLTYTSAVGAQITPRFIEEEDSLVMSKEGYAWYEVSVIDEEACTSIAETCKYVGYSSNIKVYSVPGDAFDIYFKNEWAYKYVMTLDGNSDEYLLFECGECPTSTNPDYFDDYIQYSVNGTYYVPDHKFIVIKDDEGADADKVEGDTNDYGFLLRNSINDVYAYFIRTDNCEKHNERGYCVDEPYIEGAPRVYHICAGERNTGGYYFDICNVYIDDAEVVHIVVKETAPSSDAVVISALTYPKCTVAINTYTGVFPTVVIEDSEGDLFTCLE